MNTNTKQAVAEKAAGRNRFRTREIVLVGMFAAVLAVISQISLPMPSGVPITVQVFGVALVGAVLGYKLGFLATVVYILIGAAGLPVFANFHGGIASLTGMSGGYILAWPVMALLSIIIYSFVAFIPKDVVITVLAVILGTQIRNPLVKAGYLV